ncbi:ABC-three component system middle component 1 [Silanimonas sp.]|jgi:hypothetical protein|uniref:ABC-three component system middle component 1 n=1 Tax=Silanimonas sp. TaxID=1929290 RepID=UPI0037C8DBD6
MSEILASAEIVLGIAGYATQRVQLNTVDVVAFENDTTIGFIVSYKTLRDLVERWPEDSQTAVKRFQLALKRSGNKAWNTYLVLLAHEAPINASQAVMSVIEEDLSGTRKIVRAGVRTQADVESALLPLLPLRSAPQLESVDMKQEILKRTTELPARAVEAFLSDAEESVVLRVLEEGL